MYIKKAVIENIRSIDYFEMNFDNDAAGWHVIIGDNGAGKSTVIRSIALGLLGEDNARALSSFEDFSNWLPPQINLGKIEISVSRDNSYDKPVYGATKKGAVSTIDIRRSKNGKVEISGAVKPATALWGKDSLSGWYTAAYGPYRRLRGGSDVFTHLYSSKPRLGACISAFRDDVALTQLTAWLKDLALDAQKKKKAAKELKSIINFINKSNLLPNGASLLDDIGSDGIRLLDANNVEVSLYEMSDGYRSILSMTLDIIRFLMETYGVEKVFKSNSQEVIDVPGVVLIDEVDAHLHPAWQTKIGEWFTCFFPNIQFIVTTHSALVCRACYKGSIWRLAAPGSSIKSGKIDGKAKNDLINGNILDAYGTALFGKDVTISLKAVEQKERLVKLSIKERGNKISENEKVELKQLKSIFPSNDKVEF